MIDDDAREQYLGAVTEALAEADVAAFDQMQALMSAIGMICDSNTPAFERFKLVVSMIRFLEGVEASCLAAVADENSLSDADDFDMDRQRWVQVGVDGTPAVVESLPCEIAVTKRISVTAASWLLRDVVELRARHPWTWAGVQAGTVPLWRARQIAELSAKYDLDVTEARQVDRQIHDALGVLGWGRVMKLAKATAMTVAPTKVGAHSAKMAESRYVRCVTGDDPSTSYLEAALDTSDAASFDQALNLVATALRKQGVGSSRDERRAKAIGILASPEAALALLAGGKCDASGVAQVYVHVHDTTLEQGSGVVRVERLGPAMASQLTRIIGHKRIRLTPVVYVGGAQPAVDDYVVPEKMREAVILREPYEVFPFSTRESRGLDLDHTEHFRQGLPGQTRPDNLGPLSRPAHRAKTHCGWQLNQLTEGVYEWITGYGQRFIVGPSGSTRYNDP